MSGEEAREVTIQGCELTLPPIHENAHATDVIVIIRMERVTDEGNVAETYDWSSTAMPLALRLGMAELLRDYVAGESEAVQR